ncbi:MAG: glycosyltransferase family 39 protein [Burkholderiales bacterium]
MPTVPHPAQDVAASRAATWLPFVAVLAAFACVVLQQVTLPGVYMDAVNPDYMAVLLLNRHAQPVEPWLLPGNLLFGKAPILISFYHGSQQLWLGLPFFWLFGTDVTGIRLTHAMFGVGVLAALYALLARAGMKPWAAALACIALALDPGFSYAFRTQSYITMAPAAWLLFALYALLRAGAPGARAGRWLFAAGVAYGLAVVGYFVYAFFLPALLYALYALRPPTLRLRTTWGAATLGVLAGGSAYVVGYALLARQMGGVVQMWSYFQQTQRALNAFSEQPDLATRLTHVQATIESVFANWFHHTLMFGEHGGVPGSSYKMALLLGLPVGLWAWLEWRRAAPRLLRVLVLMGVTFVAIGTTFGTRLSGHHFMVLLPLSYAALALSLTAKVAMPGTRLTIASAVVPPLMILVGLNVAGQFEEGRRLAETRGVAYFSDAINRLAADLDAAPVKPFLVTPDWGLQMPVALMTGGRVGIDSIGNLPGAKAKLCAGRDVAVAFVTGDRDARIAQWQRDLGWDAPVVRPYAQADGKVVFALATFTGRKDAPACAS